MKKERAEQIKIRFEDLNLIFKKIETHSINSPLEDLVTENASHLKLLQNQKKRSFATMISDLELLNSQKKTKKVIDLTKSVEPASSSKELDFPLNDFFKATLKHHQLEGVKFMWKRIYKQKEGCLLSHSMGLGKSLQTVAFLTTLYENLYKNPGVLYPTGKKVLILAPLVTLSNWMNEFRKWYVEGFSDILGQVFNFSGVSPDQKEARLKYIEYWHSNGGVMLINYDQFRHLLLTSQNNEDFNRLLVNPGPDVVVLDEGHVIRNAASQISQLVCNFRTRARICLTGYPLQNHLLEYYHMLDFIAPGMLGGPEVFKSFFAFYIEKSYADSSDSVKRNALKRFYILQLLTDEVTHRRDVAVLEKELPPKTEYVVKLKMTDIQIQGYKQALKTMDSHGSLLDNLFVLRTICNHPKIFQKILSKRKSKRREKFYIREASHLLDRNYEGNNDTNSRNIDESANINSEEAIFEIEETEIPDWDDDAYSWTIEYFKNSEIESWKSSNKISFIVDLVMNCRIFGEKVIIVSHSLASHDYLQHLFSIIDIKNSRVDGNTFSNERQSIIDDFNSDNNKLVLLLSAKAAAIGVNVTGASRIVLMDQDWNPLYDEQSIGRIYRYGQPKPVTVYRLVTDSSIEERIFTQSLHKKSIARRLIDNKASCTVSKEDLKGYYIQPNTDPSLADLDYVRENMRPDYVTYEVLFQNKDFITNFDFYKMETLAVHIPEAKLTKKERKIASMDALTFLKKWRYNYKASKHKEKKKRNMRKKK